MIGRVLAATLRESRATVQIYDGFSHADHAEFLAHFARSPMIDLQIFPVQTSDDVTSEWFLYVLRCADDTLYTGITTDLNRRIHEHNHSPRGAKYTASRRPVELAGAWEKAGHSEAASAEWHFKKLTRQQKLARLEKVSDETLRNYLSDEAI